MVLAQPVYHPLCPGHILLKPGAVLDPGTLSRLVEYKVGSLWIRYPALAFLSAYINPRASEEQARLTAMLADGFDAVSRDGCAQFEFAAYAAAVGALLKQIMAGPRAAMFIHDMHSAKVPLLTHSSNVSFLSLLLGLRLDGYLVDQRARLSSARAKRIENLGLGALLHDIGILALKPEAQARWHASHNTSDPEIRRHVLLGFEMLRTHIPATAAAVALHHHQRFNGSGFPSIPRLGNRPAPLSGRQIHIFSRIVAVADAFDRLRHPPVPPLHAPSNDRPVPVVRVLRTLLRDAAARAIDPVVYRALLAVVPAYAPGSIVRLSDGDEAVVTGWSPEDPCRPRVRHLLRIDAGASDESSLGPVIDLRAHDDMAIAHADGEDVSNDNFGRHELRAVYAPAHAAMTDTADPASARTGSAAA